MTHYVYQSRTAQGGRWVTLPETIEADAVRVQSMLDNVARVNMDAGWVTLRIMRVRQVTRWETYGDPVTTAERDGA